MSKKLDDWQPRLVSYLRSISNTPFKWGEHDCFIFTGECVKAMTGNDYVDSVKGKYTNADKANELAKQHGFKSHFHYIGKTFPARPSRLHAQRGDIILAKGGVLGICQGAVIYAAGDNGLVAIPATETKKAFEV